MSTRDPRRCGGPRRSKWNGAGKCHKRTQRTGRSLAHVLFLSAALSLLSALVRRERRQLVLTARDRRKKVRVAPRRIAASLAFATLFFAGAALSAGAGNGVVQLIDPSSESRRSDGGHDRHDHRPRRRPPPRRTRRRTRPTQAAGQRAAAPSGRRSRRRTRVGGSDEPSGDRRPRASAVSQSPDGSQPRTRTSPASARRSGRGSTPGSGSRASRRPHTRGRAAPRWFPPVSSARRFRLWSRR